MQPVRSHRRRRITLAAAALAVGAATATAAAVDAQDDAPDDVATSTVVHAIPGVVVDVVVSGEVLVAGMELGDVQDVSAFAGTSWSMVELRDAETGDQLVGPIEDIDVPAGGGVSLVAHLDADGDPSLTRFDDELAPVGPGEGRVTFRHTAMSGPLDVTLRGKPVAVGLGNGQQWPFAVPATDLVGLAVGPAGGDPVVTAPTVRIDPGTNLAVYVVGGRDGSPPGFLVQALDPVPQQAASSPAGTAGDEASDGTGEEPATDAGSLAPPNRVDTGGPLARPDAWSRWVAAAGLALGAVAFGAYGIRRRPS